MCAVMAGLYVLALLIPATQSFFALTSLSLGMIATSLLASGVSIAALALCGFTLRASGR